MEEAYYGERIHNDGEFAEDGQILCEGGQQMLNLLKDKKVIFFDVGYTLDAPASGDWMFTNQFLEVIRDALAEIIQNQKAFIPTNDGKNVGRNAADNVGINRDVVMKILKKQSHSTVKSLAEAMNLSPRQVERVLAELKKEGKIVRKGSNKSGWLEVN